MVLVALRTGVEKGRSASNAKTIWFIVGRKAHEGINS